MNRRMLRDHLAQAEEHVRQGERHILRQQGLIARLFSGGHDLSLAKHVLSLFEASQALHVDHRDRLTRELTNVQN
jgi:hypothetical protein